MAESEDIVSTETETEEVENTETDGYTPKDEYSYEEVVAMEKRLKKAEAALVEKKREAKAEKQKASVESTSTESNYITKQELALDRFLDKNPEMEDYKEDLLKHTARGLSLQEAKVLVENSDAIKNREKTKKTSISFSEGGAKKSTYSRADLENMSQKEYAAIRRQVEDGKVVIKG